MIETTKAWGDRIRRVQANIVGATQDMTAEVFSAWVAHMKATRHWSARECSRQLGCGVNQIAIWSERGAPPYIALACAALAYGLPPWRQP